MSFAGYWVHGKTGEVRPIADHATDVLHNHAQYGLTQHDVHGITGGKTSINPGETAPESDRGRLINAAARKGWVRVRQYGNQTNFQLHGHAPAALAKATDAMKKHGAIHANSTLFVSDMATGFEHTFDGHAALKKAISHGDIPDHSGEKSVGRDAVASLGVKHASAGVPTALSDKGKRAILHQRLLQAAGIGENAEGQMRGREAAWWVHPKTGEVVPVQYHAKTVADNPKKFGLTHADIRKASAGVSSFDGRRVNPLDKKAGSAARDLIGQAAKNGWVRVRHMNPSGVQIQSHGGGEHIHKVIGALEKRGVRFRGNVTLDMPEQHFTKTFATAEHLASASKGGEIPSFSGKKPAFATDQAARNSLRSRLYAAAGLSMHERARLIKEAMDRKKAGVKEAADGDDTNPDLNTPSGTARKVGLSGPALAAAVATQMAKRKTEPKVVPSLPMDNSPPLIGTADPTPALYFPPDYR